LKFFAIFFTFLTFLAVSVRAIENNDSGIVIVPRDETVKENKKKEIRDNAPKESEKLELKRGEVSELTPERESQSKPASQKQPQRPLEDKNETKQATAASNTQNQSENSSSKPEREGVVLPEVSSGEIEQFSEVTPVDLHKQESYVLRGIISIFLVVAGATTIAVVLMKKYGPWKFN
jgi:Na+-transporting methylmalonyl-CoA/oxaloacetate decarboxylase gamma subunit